MATARPNYYCHKCQSHIGHVTDFTCPRCQETFIEEVPAPSEPSSQSRSGQRRVGGTFQIHGGTPFGNTTIYFGSSPSQNNANGDLGNFLQAALNQLIGGLTGGAGSQQIPLIFPNAGGATFLDPQNFDAFLTQFLNQMGDNSGPAPAPEDRITAIPTVRITAEQAHDNLQCAICMDDFKENDQAKRLPCSHHFHDECILRWLRLHGTCPTCRVTLDHSFQSQSRLNNNGSGSASGGTIDLLEFD